MSGLKNLKRTGDSTRKLDRMVQEYFNLGFTFVYDSRVSLKNEQQFDHALIEKFKARMSLEHPEEHIVTKVGYFSGIFSVYVQSVNSKRAFPLTDLEKEHVEAEESLERKWMFKNPGLDSGMEDRLEMLETNKN